MKNFLFIIFISSMLTFFAVSGYQEGKLEEKQELGQIEIQNDFVEALGELYRIPAPRYYPSSIPAPWSYE